MSLLRPGVIKQHKTQPKVKHRYQLNQSICDINMTLMVLYMIQQLSLFIKVFLVQVQVRQKYYVPQVRPDRGSNS